MTLGKPLHFSSVQEDNNANHEVTARARLENGAESTSRMSKHAGSSYRKKKSAMCLGGHRLIIYRERCLSKVIVILF